jgi:hypothetical protein
MRRIAPGHVKMVRDCLIDLLDRPQLEALADALGTVGARLRDEARPPRR